MIFHNIILGNLGKDEGREHLKQRKKIIFLNAHVGIRLKPSKQCCFSPFDSKRTIFKLWVKSQIF